MAKWAKTPSLEGKFPPKRVVTALTSVRQVIQTVVAILNVVQAILNVIKVFALGLNNPLALIVRALIAQLKQILNDLQRSGVYIHGDIYRLRWPFDGSTGIDLTGAYPAYRTRMIRRLTDSSDPDRPIFSNQTQIVGLFLYAQADGTEIVRIIRFLRQLFSLFGDTPDENAFPDVVDVNVGYGWENNNLVNLPIAASLLPQNVGRLGIPSIANVTWSLSGSGPLQGITKYAPPVSGFLIEVSVYEGGLIPVYSTPVPSNTDTQGTPFQAYGRYLDPEGREITIYGGGDQLQLRGVAYNDAVNADGVDVGRRVAYLLRNPADTTPIPIELLKSASVPLLQRTFYTRSTATRALYLNQKFSFRLRAEEMPWLCDFETLDNGQVRVVPGSLRQATNVFVRIRPVADTVRTPTDFAYIITPVAAYSTVWSTVPVGSDVGSPSRVFQVSFPVEEDVTYASRVQTALQVLVLTRPDLDPEQFTPKGLEGYSRSLLPNMASTLPASYYRKTDTSRSFRKELRNRSETVASQVLSSVDLSPVYKADVIARTNILDEFKWSQADPLLPNTTISQSVNDLDSVAGPARNVNAIYDLGKSSQEPARTGVISALRARNSLVIDPSLSSIQNRVPVIVNAEPGSPVNSLTNTGYVRDIRTVLPDEVYTAADIALQGASVPYLSSPGGWIRVRLFTQAIPGLDDAIQTLVNFLEELDQGLKGVIDAIVEYIEFLSARVRELTELLLRLDQYLNFLLNFDIPQLSALFVTASGTDGLVSELMNAENDPQSDGDPTAVYGAGLVFVAGGLPTFVLDILGAIFPSE